MIVSVVYFIIYFFLFLVLLALLLFNRKQYSFVLTNSPRISILIAARNEEHNILHCLQAIEQLDYPKNKIEVLIGDDASTDRTREVVEAYIRDKSHYKCYTVTERMGMAQGKANVLAHLARQASTDYYFLTDADITVPRKWLQALLSQMNVGVGVVTGITTTTGSSLFERLQALDWLYALGLMQVVSELKLPVSTMGNNMLIRREAYEAVGGFESIDFSVTEDVAIFKQIINKGWHSRNVYDRNALAQSVPVENVRALLHQRKRWMRGSVHLPFYMVAILVLHAAYYPVLLPFFIHTSVGVMLAIFFGKLFLQSLFAHLCLKRIGQSASWWLYVVFELFLVISSFVLIVFFFLPTSIRWKGRRY